MIPRQIDGLPRRGEGWMPADVLMAYRSFAWTIFFKGQIQFLHAGIPEWVIILRDGHSYNVSSQNLFETFSPLSIGGTVARSPAENI